MPELGEVLLTELGDELKVVGVLVNLEDSEGYIDGYDLSTIQTDRDLIYAMQHFYHPLLPDGVVCVYDGLCWTLTMGDKQIEVGGSFHDAVEVAWARLYSFS